jgi:predicted RNA methylase
MTENGGARSKRFLS